MTRRRNTGSGTTLTSPAVINVESSSLEAISSTVTFHIWTLNSMDLTISDNSLRRVEGWVDMCGVGGARYQTARLETLAEFQYGSTTFSTDVWPVVSDRVS